MSLTLGTRRGLLTNKFQFLEDYLFGLSGDKVLYPFQNVPGDASSVALARNNEIGAIAASSAFPGSQLLSNPGNPFTFTGDDPDNWNVTGESGNDPEVSEVDAGQLHGGTSVTGGYMNIYTTTDAITMFQIGVIASGKRYQSRVTIDGVGTGSLAMGIGQNSADLVFGSPGVFINENVADGTSVFFRRNTVSVNATVCAIELREANPLNGDITGATVGQSTGLLAIPYGYSFDGNTDYVDIYSAELNSVLNRSAGTQLIFAQSTGWGAAYANNVLFGLASAAFADQINMQTDGTGNNFVLTYTGNTASKAVSFAASQLATDMFMLALTWDTAPGTGEFKAYLNGVQQGTTQTGLTAWAGNLDPANCAIGSLNTGPSFLWDGIGAMAAIYTRALTPVEILQIAYLAGVAG